MQLNCIWKPNYSNLKKPALENTYVHTKCTQWKCSCYFIENVTKKNWNKRDTHSDSEKWRWKKILDIEAWKCTNISFSKCEKHSTFISNFCRVIFFNFCFAERAYELFLVASCFFFLFQSYTEPERCHSSNNSIMNNVKSERISLYVMKLINSRNMTNILAFNLCVWFYLGFWGVI